MVTYVINKTDINNPSINVDEKTVNQQLPIALFGREKLEYGELMNENILHLLENFACPQDLNTNVVQPLISDGVTEGALQYTLQNAVEGQLWYNSTPSGDDPITESPLGELLFVYKMVDGTGTWVPLSLFSEVAANYGTIAHGEQIPLPVSSTGATFTYDECSWMVSPFNYDDDIDYMVCTTDDDDATVRMQYRTVGSTALTNGVANYMIIGIRGNVNRGINDIQPPAITPTSTPQPTMTPTPTFGVTATVTPTVTITPTSSPIPATVTPTPTGTPPNSVEPFGKNARLYIYPSPGYTNSVDSNATTYHKDSCGDLVWPDQDPSTVAAFRHLYFSYALERTSSAYLVGLDGGVPPYTVDWGNMNFVGSNLTTTYMLWPGDSQPYTLPAEPEINYFYLGGTRLDTSNYQIRINVDPGETVRMTGNTNTGNNTSWPDLDAVSYMGWWMEAYGYVTATDSVGTSITWWLTEDSTQTGGSNQRTNPGSVYRFRTTWDHYYDCSLCPGSCLSQLRILGYP